MFVPGIIARKRNGGALDERDIRGLLRAYTDGEVPDYQMSALLMAIFFRGMSPEELAVWADAMLRSGEVLDLSQIPAPKADKHSTGGVGDKVSLVLAPLVAATGVAVPMISGRGLGHTGGTLDKLESIPGFSTMQSLDRFRELVREHGCGLIGQTESIAPADRKLYALRDVTATVECIPLIASSIMSKKLAEGIDALVLDVKVGSGAFMKTADQARLLAQTMIGIGRLSGKQVTALLTDMDQPLGEAIGNALEVRESIDLLRGGGPGRVRELTLRLSAEMLVSVGRTHTHDEAMRLLTHTLDSGAAWAKWLELVEAHGGDPKSQENPDLLPTAPHIAEFTAPEAGWIARLDNEAIGRAGVVLGAGRARKEDEVDPAVGFMWRAPLGARVERGDVVAHIHWRDQARLRAAVELLDAAVSIGDPVEAPPLIRERIG
jgi:pyrimidine-nucleoside phosphorylase